MCVKPKYSTIRKLTATVLLTLVSDIPPPPPPPPALAPRSLDAVPDELGAEADEMTVESEVVPLEVDAPVSIVVDVPPVLVDED